MDFGHRREGQGPLLRVSSLGVRVECAQAGSFWFLQDSLVFSSTSHLLKSTWSSLPSHPFGSRSLTRGHTLKVLMRTQPLPSKDQDPYLFGGNRRSHISQVPSTARGPTHQHRAGDAVTQLSALLRCHGDGQRLSPGIQPGVFTAPLKTFACVCASVLPSMKGSQGHPARVLPGWNRVLPTALRSAHPLFPPLTLLSPRSFTWLCGHVHRNILSKFTGPAVELFDEEFRHLYASSKPVMGPKSPRLAAAPQPRAGHSPPPGRLSGSSCSASDHTASNPFSSPSTGSNPQNRTLSALSGPGSPLAPNLPLPPRLQPHHGLWGTLSPPAHFSPRPHDTPAPYSNLNAYRPTRLQLEQLGLVPRAAHIWRPFLQASPHF